MTDRPLYQMIARRLAKQIDNGKYPPGSRLPAERDLAEQFGVSRVTIREAEIALQAQGRISIRKGSGVYVTDNWQDVETVAKDGERDKFFTADEAKAYGLVDEVFSFDAKKDDKKDGKS